VSATPRLRVSEEAGSAKVQGRRWPSDREVDVPDGYTRFRGAGVSFVHPQGWRVTERESADGAPSVQVTAPDETDTPGPLIQLIVGSGALVHITSADELSSRV
jgi:hypothetical protein